MQTESESKKAKALKRTAQLKMTKTRSKQFCSSPWLFSGKGKKKIFYNLYSQIVQHHLGRLREYRLRP